MEALIVERDEALGLARELAERQGTSIDDAVIAALRESLRVIPRTEPLSPRRIPALEDLTPEQRERYESLRAFVRETAMHRVPGATSDHRDMYDARGLPI